MMKKLSLVFLSLVVLCASLAGCASLKPGPSENPARDPGTINLNLDPDVQAEISILIPSGNANETTMIDALIDSFNLKYPYVTFKYSYVSVNSYENTIRNLARTGSLDDIFWTNSPDLYYPADTDIAENLTPYIEATENAGVFDVDVDFYQEFFDCSSVNGQLYAIPRSADSVVTFVNTDILRKAGVDLNPETTVVKDGWSWDEFLGVCQQVRDYLDRTGRQSDYVLDANLTAWLSTCYPILRSYGADILDNEGKNAVDSAETRACLEMLRDMVEKRYIVDTSKESASSFEAGTSAFLFQSASVSLYANRPALKNKIDLVSFPLIGENPKIGSGIAGYMINAKLSEEEKDVCWAFLCHMLSYDGQQAMGAAGLNLASIRRDLADYTTANWGKDYSNINMGAYLYGSEYKIAVDFLARVDASYKSDLERATKGLFNNALNLSKSIEDAIESCVAEVDNAMIG